MLCCVNKYSTWRGIKKAPKMQSNIYTCEDSGKTSNQAVLLRALFSSSLFFFFFLFLLPFVGPFLLLLFYIESCSYRERSSTKPQRWSWWLAVAKDQPCGRSYSSLDEPFIKSIHVPKNTSKIFLILGLCFSSCVFYKLIKSFWKPHPSFKVNSL